MEHPGDSSGGSDAPKTPPQSDRGAEEEEDSFKISAFRSRRLLHYFYLVGFLDFFGVSMVIPLLNLHVRSLGASPMVAGIVDSSYGFLQLFSSTLVGCWSDVVGRRPSLLLCILCSALGYLILAVSTNVYLFLVARVSVGIFKHTISISKALLSDLVSENERPMVIGHFNTASSLGFILGPVVGGHLTEFEDGFYLTAFLCFSIFLLNAGLVWLVPCSEETLDHTRNQHPDTKQRPWKEAEHPKPIPRVSAQGKPDQAPRSVLQTLLNTKDQLLFGMWELLTVHLLMALSVLLYQSNLVLDLQQRFSMRPWVAGYLISGSNILSALTGLAVGPILQLYHHNSRIVLYHACALTGLGLLLHTVAYNMALVLAAAALLAVSTTIGKTCLTHLQLTAGGSKSGGTLVGLTQSVTAIGRASASLFSGLVQEFSPCGPPAFGVVLSLVAVCIMSQTQPSPGSHAGDGLKQE